MNISGNISGVGNPSYYINNSRKQAFNPQLVIDDKAYSTGDCPIFALEYLGFSPNNIINLISNEELYYENTQSYHTVEKLEFDGYTYPLNYYSYCPSGNETLRYLVTDQTTDINIPLFYQYELMFDAYNNSSGNFIKNIYKNNEILINKNNYKIQYSNDLLSQSGRYTSTTWVNNTTNITSRIRVLLPIEFSNKNDFYTIEYEKFVNNVNLYQKELIELSGIYNNSDYIFSISGILLSDNSRLYNNTLYLIKDFNYSIKPADIVTIKSDSLYMSDQSVQWKLRFNTGSFFIPSGFYSQNSGVLYNLTNTYTNSYIPITNIKPSNIYDNILQIKETPIYINPNYTYPDYTIESYNILLDDLYDASGKFLVSIDGVPRNDIQIKSIDRNKGFIEFNYSFNNVSEIELTYYLDTSESLILENFELNPKLLNTGSTFHISNYPNGFGIALKNSFGENNYLYIYDLNTTPDSRIVSGVLEIGNSGVLNSNWDNTFFTVCYGSLNELSIDNIKKTDCRRIGGGLQFNNSLDNWFNKSFSGYYINEKKWYTDIGYYDGEPFNFSNLIFINIPQDYLDNSYQEWLNYYKKYNDYNTTVLIATREYKFYLDKYIRNYISAGTDYIILPTVSGIITGKIYDLR